MSQKILFFPMSMPDETLHSRVTRYHLLSGNRTERETFQDLFGTHPFPLKIIPKQIEDLATRLPGDKIINLNELLTYNTILPAYKPFLGVPEISQGVHGESIMPIVARVPRREVSSHSMAKICLSCVHSDLVENGYSYWHRAHHIPGITACWRHGEPLLQSCPSCTHPFYRLNKLLPTLSNQCVCGWSPINPGAVSVSPEIERKLAQFAKDLLDRNLPAVPSKILADCYRRQAKKRGFTYGKNVSTSKMFDSIESKYGPDLLSRIDNAYASGKHHQWIRTTIINEQLDMPITRHLIISHHLFDSIDSFERSLTQESLLFGEKKTSSVKKIKSASDAKLTLHRLKVSQLIEARPNANLDYLWKHAYQAVLWLNVNDKKWLLDKITSKERIPNTKEPSANKFDGTYAEIIKERIKEIYDFSKKPVRANISNILALLPKRIKGGISERKSTFPLVSEQLELHFESLWHFRLRRALWGLSEMRRLELTPNTSSAQLLTSLPSPAWGALVSYFEWDLEKMMKDGIDIEKELANTNVTHKWEGLPEYDQSIGGRAYVSVRARS
jgi:hypothetical protein